MYQALRGRIIRRSFENMVSTRLASTARVSEFRLMLANSYFQNREKIDVILSAATSWYGGDYFEFGSAGLNTFRDMLSAFHIASLPSRFPATRFYAFDVFGRLTSPNRRVEAEMTALETHTGYFSQIFPDGDIYAEHMALLREHGLFVDQCHLVQGFFQDTLSAEFKSSLKSQNRQIGFAFIDCNFEEHYKIVFEFIYDLMAENSYIYMDEYFQSSGAAHYFNALARRMRNERGIDCAYIRSAGAFGGLFRLWPIRTDLPD